MKRYLFSLLVLLLSLQTVFSQTWEQHFSVMGVGSVRWVEHADLDGDELEDVILASNAHFSWVKNLGNGQFAHNQLISPSSGVSRPQVVDIEGDGDIDIYTDNNLYRNDGNGQFEQIDLSPTLSFVERVADLDNDDLPDLITFNFTEGTLWWYRNTGGLNFEAVGILTDNLTPVTLNDVQTADLEDDGDMDILLSTDNGLQVFTNDSNGIFTTTTVSNISTNTATAGDLDGDEDLDLVIKENSPDQVVVYFQQDDGSWSGEQFVSTCIGNVGQVEVIDMDQDGDEDLFFARINTRIGWFDNDGAGNFSLRENISAILPSVCHGVDLNDDGNLDLLTYRSGLTTDQPKVAWYPNQDDSFPERRHVIIHFLDSNRPTFAAADLDQDGDQDLVVQHQQIRRSMNQGEDRLSIPEVVANGSAGRDVILRDANGDEFPDLLGHRNDSLFWFINDGSGAFPNEQFLTTLAYSFVNAMEAADLDGDGDLDVLASSFDATGNAEVFLLDNLDNQGYDKQMLNIDSDRPYHFALGDYNQDDHLDFALTTLGSATLALFESQEGGGYISFEFFLAEPPETFHFTDLNGDQRLDLLYSTSAGTGSLIYQIGMSPGWDLPTYLQTFFLGPTTTILCEPADLDGDGRQDILFTVDFMRVDDMDFRARAGYMLGEGGGNFSGPAYFFEYQDFGYDWEYLQLADMNGDGKLDPIMHYFAEGLNVDFADDEFDDIAWFKNTLEAMPAIELTSANSACNNNGTYNNIEDDYLDLELNIRGSALAETYTISSEDGMITPASGTYNTNQAFVFTLTILGTDDLTLKVTDANDDSFTLNVTVSNTAGCSNYTDLVDPIIGSINCLPGDTPNDPSDDFISFELTLASGEFSDNYLITGPGFEEAEGNYNAFTTFESLPGSAGAGDLTLTISHAADTSLTEELIIADPGSCATNNSSEVREKVKVIAAPNPFQDAIWLQFEGLPAVKSYTLELTNSSGAQVGIYPLAREVLTINAANLSSGVYIYQLRENDSRQVIAGGQLIKS